MSQYNSYKPSGVIWLGNMPDHWKVERLKDISDVVLGKMLCNEDPGEYSLKPYLKSKNIGWNNLLLDQVEEMWFSNAELSRLRISSGDILMTEGGEVGKTSIWNNEIEECYIQNSVHKITFDKKNNSRFFLYQLNHIGLADVFKNIVSQVSIGHLTKEKLVQVKVLTPPLSEQTAIADYLDSALNNLEIVIETKQQQLEKLDLYKKATIHEAITKGLNKNVKRKPSGIEFIGDVPIHWKNDKISRIVEFSASGGTPTSTNESYYGGDILWVQTGELNDCEIYDTEKKLSESGYKNSSSKIFPIDTLLIAMYGATIGKLGILKVNASTNQACCALFFNNKKWNIRFFFYHFLNIRDKLINSSYGGGQPNINQDVIRQETLFVPPLNEQTSIVVFLDSFCTNLANEKTIIEQQIATLQQYRKSLIHDCVTGKRKVI